ncbi:MAG: 2-succinyl-5-enolpyruvyl-6-hydroxy-3-cyclohexene-1-carboxylic-acid synthase [Naasia sp.]
MSDRPSPASRSATALIGRLAENGVGHVVVCPGSRSQALALGTAAAAARGELTLHVRIDERSAGFLALGLARGSRQPVAVVTTSGTAVANLHPVMLEAWHSGDPLIVLTADRPHELRGTGANQTTRQPDIFGPATVLAADVEAPGDADDVEGDARHLADRAVAAARGDGDRDRGPVHLNLAFREPLSGPVAMGAAGAPAPVAAPREPAVRVLPRGPRTIVVAGTGAGSDAEGIARLGGWPLIAEVTSGARFGPQLVPAYRAVISGAGLAEHVQRALVFGRPNLSREVSRLLSREGIEIVLVGPHGAEPVDPRRTASRAAAVRVEGEPSTDEVTWTRQWIGAGRAAVTDDDEHAYRGGGEVLSPAEQSRLMRAELAATRAPVTRRALVEAVWRATWPHDRLWFAASRLVRIADDVLPGKKVPVLSSRGLAGIDGTVSSALGVALAVAGSERAATGTTRVLIGDLALLHDVGGLFVPDGEPRPRVQLVVGNDRGGTIFQGLEVSATADPTDFERVMITPQHVDISALAAAYGWEHQRVGARGDLDRALTSPPAGLSILEIPFDR